jgi:hypothetical protein
MNESGLELCPIVGILLALLDSRVLPPQGHHLSQEANSGISPNILRKMCLNTQRYATENVNFELRFYFIFIF